MAPPGSLNARYEQLAGDEDKRLELYIARTHLRFTIDEWLALPWWQRRVYLEGMQAEADRADAARDDNAGAGGPGSGLGGSDPLAAIYGGTLGDVAGYGYRVN